MKNVASQVTRRSHVHHAASTAVFVDAAEERRLVLAAQAGGKRELDLLVRSHLRLVLSVAAKFNGKGCDLDDLVGEGLLGLVEAVSRFDVNRGFRLSTYALWWIRAYVRRYTIFHRRIVRPPSTRNARILIAHLRKTQDKLSTATGEAPEHADVASALNVSKCEVEEMDEILKRRDASLGPAADGTIFELPCGAPSPESVTIAKDEMRRAESGIRKALRELSPRERDVFVERSLTDTPKSLGEIGAEIGLSRERVRQIQKHGFAKVRAAMLAEVA